MVACSCAWRIRVPVMLTVSSSGRTGDVAMWRCRISSLSDRCFRPISCFQRAEFVHGMSSTRTPTRRTEASISRRSRGKHTASIFRELTDPGRFASHEATRKPDRPGIRACGKRRALDGRKAVTMRRHRSSAAGRMQPKPAGSRVNSPLSCDKTQ